MSIPLPRRLLVGVVLCLMVAPVAPAADAPPCPSVADAIGGVTLRPRGQLGLKLDGSDTPMLEKWHEKVGIRLEDVDCFALVWLDDNERKVLAVRTKRPVRQGSVMLACYAGTSCGRRCGPTMYTGRSGLAVAFPEPTLALIADSPATMDVCLTELPLLGKHLEQGSKHDLTTWAKGVPYREERARACGYRAVAPVTSAERNDMVMMLGHGPLPFAARVARVALNIRECVGVHVELVCADAKAAGEAARLLRSGVDIWRGMLLTQAGMFGVMQAMGDEQAKKLPLPLDLVPLTEKALARSAATVKGKSAYLSLRIPVSGQRIGAELKNLQAIGGQRLCVLADAGPGLFFGKKASVAQEAPAAAAVPIPVAPAGPSVEALPFWHASTTSSTPTCPSAEALPAPPPAAITVTLTVANVRKETLLLFKLDAGGDLKFVRKVPAGDAVDVTATVGERWVAMEMDGPRTAKAPEDRKTEDVRLFKHVVAGERTIWLLRP